MTTRKRLIGALVVVACLAVGLVAIVALLAGRDDDRPKDSATSERRSQPESRPGSSDPDQTPTTDSPGSKNPERTPGPVVVKDHRLQSGLISREYLTVVPESTDPGEKLPVVMVLHGFGVDRTQMLNSADWKAAVGRDRFIAVFPQGFGNSWNLGPCCPPSSMLGVDDRGFLDQVLGQVKSIPDVDPDRVYITGFSAGALMAYAVVCARPGVYSAMAPVGGSNLLRCKPSEPIPLLHQHSDPDPVVPYNGGLGLGQILSSTELPSVPDTVADWAAANGCDPAPTRRTADSGEERITWGGCEAGAVVELVRLPGVGHEWPKLASYDALDELLKFFDLE